MNGFATSWLGLRAPADRAARNRRILGACTDWAAAHARHAVDLGCGTGATLEALAPLLGRRLRWTLVDNDPALLALASDWAARMGVTAESRAVSLDAPASAWAPGDADLMTASALIDLAGARFLDRLADAAAARGAAVYVALSVDGRLALSPSHANDKTVLGAFQADQGRDKGLGPALGGAAHDHLVRRLREAGFEVLDGRSDWSLRPTLSHALIEAMLTGLARAPATPHPASESWLADRLAALAGGDLTLRVGHRDLFAAPPR